MSSPSLLAAVLQDLDAESSRLEAVVADLDDAAWRTPTPAEGWDVATTIAHLAWTDECSCAAGTDPERWSQLMAEAMANPTGYADEQALLGAQAGGAGLLARWRTSREQLAAMLASRPDGAKIPWFGPPMSAASMATARFMETWAHGLDVDDALGVVTTPTDRIRHVAHLGVRTRDYAYAVRRMAPPSGEFRIELVAPSGAVWEWGPEAAEQRLTGPAYDFCRLVTQRSHRDDLALVAHGPDVEVWLGIAQAFAGPPGNGRPGQ